MRQRGHSKEGRDNDPQVVIGLAVAHDGVPVRSWVFLGDTPDVKKVQRIKEDLRGMRPGRTLFVGDAGLFSKVNLQELAKGACKYILATPLRRIKEIRAALTSTVTRCIAPSISTASSSSPPPTTTASRSPTSLLATKA